MTYRVDNHSGKTIIREGEVTPGYEGEDTKTIETVGRVDTKEFAQRIVRLLNEDDARHNQRPA